MNAIQPHRIHTIRCRGAVKSVASVASAEAFITELALWGRRHLTVLQTDVVRPINCRLGSHNFHTAPAPVAQRFEYEQTLHAVAQRAQALLAGASPAIN